MGKMGTVSITGMKQFQKKLDKIPKQETDAFIEACSKELAARLLAKVIKRTPVGDYSKEMEVTAKRDSKHHKKGDIYKKKVNPSGKLGGTLRRGWTSKTHEEAAAGRGKRVPDEEEVKRFVDSLEIRREGNLLTIELINPVNYASYVEHGHRQTPGRYVPALGKRLKQGCTEGTHMLEYSEQELKEIAPNLLEVRVKELLKRYLV